MRLLDIQLDKEGGVLHVQDVALDGRVWVVKHFTHGEVHKHGLETRVANVSMTSGEKYI